MAGRNCRSAIERSLFDLVKDPGETRNVIGDHPELAERLNPFAEGHQKSYIRQEPSKLKKNPIIFVSLDREGNRGMACLLVLAPVIQ